MLIWHTNADLQCNLMPLRLGKPLMGRQNPFEWTGFACWLKLEWMILNERLVSCVRVAKRAEDMGVTKSTMQELKWVVRNLTILDLTWRWWGSVTSGKLEKGRRPERLEGPPAVPGPDASRDVSPFPSDLWAGTGAAACNKGGNKKKQHFLFDFYHFFWILIRNKECI